MFKIGDYVKIKDKITLVYTPESINNKTIFIPTMAKFLGKKAKIFKIVENISGEKIYILQDLEGKILGEENLDITYGWLEDWLEPLNLEILEVGTKVKIVDDFVFNKETPKEILDIVGINFGMTNYLGKTATITGYIRQEDFTNNVYYYLYNLDIDGGSHFWHSYFFKEILEG